LQLAACFIARAALLALASAFAARSSFATGPSLGAFATLALATFTAATSNILPIAAAALITAAALGPAFRGGGSCSGASGFFIRGGTAGIAFEPT
jgi:hypothetical protein